MLFPLWEYCSCWSPPGRQPADGLVTDTFPVHKKHLEVNDTKWEQRRACGPGFPLLRGSQLRVTPVTSGTRNWRHCESLSAGLIPETLNARPCLGSDQCLLSAPRNSHHFPGSWWLLSPHGVGVMGLEEVRHLWWLWHLMPPRAAEPQGLETRPCFKDC